MPHDKNGKLLQVGDKAVVPGTLTQIFGGENACNVMFQPDKVEGEFAGPYSFNSKFVVKEEDE